MSIKVITSGGIQIDLGDKPFASGQEGGIYKIVSPPKYKDKCVKLYFPAHRNKEKEEKISYMVKNPTSTIKGNGFIICWPQELIYYQNQFSGFIMSLAFDSSIQLYSLCLPTPVKKLSAEWNTKYDRSQGKGITARLKMCVNIASALHEIHNKGMYTLVDMKPQNILITHKGEISLIDMDSMQIAAKNKVMHHARVFTPEFAPPECKHLNLQMDYIPVSWDRFSAAVIFYQILFGIHPYVATFDGPYEDHETTEICIQNNLFVYGAKAKHIKVLPKPHENFNHVPHVLQSLFVRAFESVNSPLQRPHLEEWGKTIYEIIKDTTPQNLLKTVSQQKMIVTPTAPLLKTISYSQTPSSGPPIDMRKDKKPIKPFSSWVPWGLIFGALSVYFIYSMNFVNGSKEKVGETVEKRANEARVAVEKTAETAVQAAPQAAKLMETKRLVPRIRMPRKRAGTAAQVVPPQDSQTQTRTIEVVATQGAFSEVKVPNGSRIKWYCQPGALMGVTHSKLPQGKVIDCDEKEPINLGDDLQDLRLAFISTDATPKHATVTIVTPGRQSGTAAQVVPPSSFEADRLAAKEKARSNRSGTVMDNFTKLMWQQGEGWEMNWNTAIAYCKNLSLAGHNDWRLPNIEELKSIIVVEKNPAINKSYFPNAHSSPYWSSTTHARNTSFALNVNFGNGYTDGSDKTLSTYARCVRGGQ